MNILSSTTKADLHRFAEINNLNQKLSREKQREDKGISNNNNINTRSDYPVSTINNPILRQPAQYQHFVSFLGNLSGVNSVDSDVRSIAMPDTPVPMTHILKGGAKDNNFSSIITAAGSGGIKWNNIAVTRYTGDPTSDALGNFIYLKDTSNNKIWSAGFQPVGAKPDSYEAQFSEDKAVIKRKDGDIASKMQVIVSAEDNAEVRRLSLTNNSNKEKEIELTSYSELVLAPPAADASHPAFSKLFVQTEYDPETSAIIAKRRPRGSNDQEFWAAHTIAVDKKHLADQQIQYETNRSNFIGRNNQLHNPQAMEGKLSNEEGVGIVLDPIASLRSKIRIAPGETVNVDYAIIAGKSRDEVKQAVMKYSQPETFDKTAIIAKNQAAKNLQEAGITAEQADTYQRMANKLLFSDPSARPALQKLKDSLTSTKLSAPQGLWGHGVSGDIPITLLDTAGVKNNELLKETLKAQQYCRDKGLASDIVILNQGNSIDKELKNLIDSVNAKNQKGKVLILDKKSLSDDTVKLFESVANVVLDNNKGNLKVQLGVIKASKPSATRQDAVSYADPTSITFKPAPMNKLSSLEFFNGIGGFAKDGREYVINLNENKTTPAPWVNVISNPQLGFVTSEAGGGYTWAGNSRENKLTPWCNDPVMDKPGEIFYIKDEKSGAIWSPTVNPIRVKDSTYRIHHGHGYSKFENNANGIKTELLQMATANDPVKLTSIKLENHSPEPRNLSMTNYIEWVLGVNRQDTAKNLVIEKDPETGALFVLNPLSNHFGNKVAFLDFGDASGNRDSFTGDRNEFLGSNGTLDQPAALTGAKPLQQKTGAGFDTCTAMKTDIPLKPGETSELRAIMGQAESREEARELIKKYRNANITQELNAVTDNWDKVLDKVKVKTPDKSMNYILNRWLLYQNLSCRVMGRSAFYQSGGAFGYRDQLQDIMAFCVNKPEMAKKQILRAAAHQFKEGDVLHWWHEYPKKDTTGSPQTQSNTALPELENIKSIGIRTDFKDDRVWLPYVTAFYIAATGDKDILNEKVPFVEGPQLGPDKEDVYTEVTRSKDTATLYEHCKRALNISKESGPHGLPTMGAGDWNDGMNRVGHKGTGESVWLGWFLAKTMKDFIQIAEQRGETKDAKDWQEHLNKLKVALDNTWDGEWYKRAYYDDGTPLGSKQSDECKIDVLPQSWSVISGLADPKKSQQAMEAVKKHLVDEENNMVKLFTPPFDKTKHDPGYIKGYLPGIRENGGQYTHGTIWSIDAFSKLGDGKMAGKIFNMLNPINHGRNAKELDTYKVEPYVVAADVYGAPPLEGRGGWTWYTGSAGWLYRVGLESILGINVQNGNEICVNPTIPPNWPGFEVEYKHGKSTYKINVDNSAGVSTGVKQVIVDGKLCHDNIIHLRDDGKEHIVDVLMGNDI
jgi:cyclic beta-1,2-glucan synthetase